MLTALFVSFGVAYHFPHQHLEACLDLTSNTKVSFCQPWSIIWAKSYRKHWINSKQLQRLCSLVIRKRQGSLTSKQKLSYLIWKSVWKSQALPGIKCMHAIPLSHWPTNPTSHPSKSPIRRPSTQPERTTDATSLILCKYGHRLKKYSHRRNRTH